MGNSKSGISLPRSSRRSVSLPTSKSQSTASIFRSASKSSTSIKITDTSSRSRSANLFLQASKKPSKSSKSSKTSKISVTTSKSSKSSKTSKSKSKSSNNANNDDDTVETIDLHNSCIDLEDGMYYIKPTADGLVIPVICSNWYTMIDISLNFEAITSYFSTFSYSKSDTYIIGPELDDNVSWRQWWSIADDAYSFRSAANCHKCYSDDDYGDNSAYYMSSYYFCFSTTMEPKCENNESLEGFDGACSWCDDGAGHNDDDSARIWTKCTSLRMDADTLPNTDHYNCATHSLAATMEHTFWMPPATPINDNDNIITGTINIPSKPSIFYDNNNNNNIITDAPNSLA
eukprot:270204_1